MRLGRLPALALLSFLSSSCTPDYSSTEGAGGGSPAGTGGGSAAATGGGKQQTGTGGAMGGGMGSGGGTGGGATGGGLATGVDAGTDAGQVDGGEPVDAGIDAGVDAGCLPPVFGVADAGSVEALIITNEALAPSFVKLAQLHTVTGIVTEVVTVESICAATTCDNLDPRHDMVRAIKDAIMARPGLRYVVIGGGADVVPARRVKDEYTNPIVTSVHFQGDFLTDYYYSDFSEWDTDGNGIYAEKGVDKPNYIPAVSVSRIPVHSATEVDVYVAKVLRHLTSYDGSKAGKALLVSNVATNLSGLKIDSAYYFESPNRTKAQLPPDFAVKKLYAMSVLIDPAAGAYTKASLAPALAEGQNIVVHSGHAGPNTLVTEQDGSEAFNTSDVEALTNPTLPIFLSCGCEAGDFSVLGTAGERLLLTPNGGAIVYLGNAPVGLGLAGGMQMIDELLRYVKTSTSSAPRLADAYFAAHQNLPHADNFLLPLSSIPIPVVDQNSYQWTQKGVVLMGDHLIPVWKSSMPVAPAFTASKAAVCGGNSLNFAFAGPVTGTLRVVANGQLYSLALSGQSTANVSIAQDVTSVTVGFASATTQFGFATLTF